MDRMRLRKDSIRASMDANDEGMDPEVDLSLRTCHL